MKINSYLENDARLIMIYNIISTIHQLNLFENKSSIINIGSFDLIEKDNTSLALKLLNSLNLKATLKEIESYIEKRRISSKILWEKLGFKDIKFIDPDGVHNSIQIDLNEKMDNQEINNKTFDVVTNFGTTEHIFNQYQAFKSIHDLCKKDGLMVHSLPLQGAYEHGFFNYHPNFFHALAAKNNYEIKYAGIRHKNLENYKLLDLKNYLPNDFLKNINAFDTLGSLFILKKTTSKPFEIPFQGRYDKYGKSN
ncbi:hypothetical protein CP960_13530 [Malaciobacter halophilus]|uniref:Methyltransferase type 11 domain-containing protein n=1 Tax=Malaciobacter halophilus TaxID=197482 RepID=A0A2N1IZA3_9BACT|nr:methyltransferase domain-containing protein [Malaciobacter halophilus]AXH10883.1 methyltransferase [Malaciobacter halophilus]PKI79626.1 hypothetical protein CP960_13530 [Malaciobacter halophilus]